MAFLFPGQGAQHVNMARELYEAEPLFREQVDRCSALLEPHLGLDLRTLLYPPDDQAEQAAQRLMRTDVTQPALFVIEYALARLWMQWGLRPQAMIGHSIGEYVAACLAGVFSLADALSLVAARGRMMRDQPPGAMLAVSLPEAEVQPLLGVALSLAVVNAPSLCVVAGPNEAVNALHDRLSAAGVAVRRLYTSHAFHSAMMDPVVEPFVERLRALDLQPPQIPFLSNVTGAWITAAEATDPAYWGEHLRQTVRFAQGVQALLAHSDWALLEVGPGRTLSTLARRQVDLAPPRFIFSSLPHPQDEQSQLAFVLSTLGRLWLAGAPVDWSGLYTYERRRRISLPTYPFQRQRYWVETPPRRDANGAGRATGFGPLSSQASGQDGVEPAAVVESAGEVFSLHGRPHLQNPYAPPRSEAEERIVAIWQELLGIEPVGVYDNFFDLGGHSLLATQIVSRLRETLGLDIPLRTLFEAPTVADMAEKVAAWEAAAEEAQESRSQAERRPAITPVSRDEPLPLSFAQERHWFLDRLESGSPAYNIPAVYRLRGALDVTALQRSFDEIVGRHEALRTTFGEVAGRPAQVIHPVEGSGSPAGNGSRQPLDIRCPIVDLTYLPEAEREAEAARLAEEESQRPFDLVEGPLLRTTLLRLGEQDHILFLTMHHIISDGWSMSVLLRELATLYEAFSTGRPSPLPDLSIQYADFAAWQRRWLQGEVLERQLAYWTQQLAETSVLQLPTDRPRPAVQTYRTASHRLRLPQSLVDSLRDLSRQESATLFMALLAGFQILLHRYTGQEDICVGSFVANRNRSEIEGLIGFFVNNLALRTDLSGRPSVRELLRRVRGVALEAYAHQDAPFEQVLDALQPERRLSHQPVFQVMCVLQNVPEQVRELPGLTMSPAGLQSNQSDYDLTLWMREERDGLVAELEYNPDLFDSTTIARMWGHFETLLAAMAADPQQRISDLPLLTPAEQRQMFDEWNPAPLPPQPGRYLHHLFEAQVQRTPDAVALVAPSPDGEPGQDRRLTYGELNRRADALAQHLQALGVAPGSLVGVYMGRSPEAVVAMLGVLKAGGAYVPLDPTYPSERLGFMLADTQVSVLLTLQRLAAGLPPHSASLICLDGPEWAAGGQGRPTAPALAPENLAYVIYTSGSTGRPKGVQVTHRSLMSYMEAVLPSLDLRADDTILQFASISFDATTEELYPALVSGATVVLRPDGIVAPGVEFRRLVERLGATVLSLPTAFWHEWVYEMGRGGPALPAALRMVLLNAEEPSPERFALWQALGGDRLRWINTYGPTETTVTATLFEPATAEEKQREWRKLPIGRPIANTRLYVLDGNWQPLPVGVPGELFIGGGGLTLGYLNRPALTAEAFAPDPFSDQPGARLYRTGDRVRYLPDGRLEFLERIDQQVKIRGYRVELGEIEAVLDQHPAVRETAVIAWQGQDGVGERRLVAYVVLENAEQAAGDGVADDLRRFLRDKLPDYMTPSLFVALDALPLSPNGKIDRQALPAPILVRPDVGRGFVAPRTPEEELLAEIWAEILNLEQVGVHDNFFELGGHSLLATQLVSRVRDTFGLELPLRKLFETPTVAELAVVLEEMLLEQIEGLSEEEVERLLEDANVF